MVALAAKGQKDAVSLGDVPGGMHSDVHKAANPLGKIPLFERADGKILIESQIIAEHIDRVLDGPDLIPADPNEAEQVRLICHLIDQYFAPAFTHFWPERADAETVKAVLENDMVKALDVLEHCAEGGDTLTANRFTMADAALIPWLFHMRVFGRKIGFADFGDRPKLSQWLTTTGKSAFAKDSFDRASVALKKVS